MTSHSDDASGVLDNVERLRTKVRSDRRETSVPLLALGALAAVSSLVTPLMGGSLLALSAVAVLVGLALYYRRRERSVGVGTGSQRWTTASLWVLVVYVLVPGLAMLFLPPVAIVGIVVAIMGSRSGNPRLVAGGVVAAAVSGLEQWFVISNRFWDLAKLVDAGPQTWWVSNAQPLVFVALATGLVASGVVALRRERRRG